MNSIHGMNECTTIYFSLLFQGHLGCFHFLVLINKASVNFCVWVLYKHTFSFLYDNYLGLQFLGHSCDEYIFTFIRNSQTYLHPFTFPLTVHERSIHETDVFFSFLTFIFAYVSCTGGFIVTFPSMLTMYLG
jgi:hypothetical protein